MIKKPKKTGQSPGIPQPHPHQHICCIPNSNSSLVPRKMLISPIPPLEQEACLNDVVNAYIGQRLQITLIKRKQAQNISICSCTKANKSTKQLFF